MCLIDNVVIIYQAFRYELDPTDIQRGRLASHAGAARYAWNWGLNRVKLALEARAAGDSAERHGTTPHVERLEEAAGQLLLVV